jgi:Spy/CpxP family protein refolding chaperone
MSKRWIVILLFISLAFNLAVLIMFLHISVFHKEPFFHPGFKSPSEMRDNDIRDHFRRPRPEDMLENKDEIRKLREDFREKRREFMEIMRKDNFIEEDAIKAMEATHQAQEILEKRLGESIIEYRKKLTPTEAREYFKLREDRKNERPDAK